jgi:hypothetical protein
MRQAPVMQGPAFYSLSIIHFAGGVAKTPYYNIISFLTPEGDGYAYINCPASIPFGNTAMLSSGEGYFYK